MLFFQRTITLLVGGGGWRSVKGDDDRNDDSDDVNVVYGGDGNISDYMVLQ